MAVEERSTDPPDVPASLKPRYYIVCLLDVLGQAQRLGEWAQLPAGDQLPEEFIRSLKKTVGLILGLKKVFKDFFFSFQQFSLPSEDLDRLSAGRRQNFE